jgi:hypothetical protein
MARYRDQFDKQECSSRQRDTVPAKNAVRALHVYEPRSRVGLFMFSSVFLLTLQNCDDLGAWAGIASLELECSSFAFD